MTSPTMTNPTMNKSLTIYQMKQLDLFDEVPYKWVEDYIKDDELELDVEIAELDAIPDVDIPYRTKYQFVFELKHHTRDGNHILKKTFTHTIQYAGGSTYGMIMEDILRCGCSECCEELEDEHDTLCMDCQEKEYYSKYNSIDLFQKREIEQQDWTEDVREMEDEVEITEDLPEDITDLCFRWELSFREQKMIMSEIEYYECMTIQFYRRFTRDDNRTPNTCVVYVKLDPIDRVIRCEYSGSSGTSMWLNDLGLDFEYDDN